MISLTKSYLKKIVTSPLFCICLIAFIFFSSLYNTQCLKLALTNRRETVQETESTEQDQRVVFSMVMEAVPNTSMPAPAQMTAEYLFADVAASAYPALCAALFAAQFLSDERKYRFLQNFPGIGRYPWKLVGAHRRSSIRQAGGRRGQRCKPIGRTGGRFSESSGVRTSFRAGILRDHSQQ